MSNQRNVLCLKIPILTHNNKLMNKERPYICMTNLPNLRLLKGQSARIVHYNNPSAPPINRMIIYPGSNVPFVSPTVIDCDKVFEVLNVSFIDPALLMRTPERPSSISVEAFDNVQRKLKLADFVICNLPLAETSSASVCK